MVLALARPINRQQHHFILQIIRDVMLEKLVTPIATNLSQPLTKRGESGINQLRCIAQ